MIASQIMIPQSVGACFEFHPAIKRTFAIAGSLTSGSLEGSFDFVFFRLFNQFGLIGQAGETIHPLPYVLKGIFNAAMSESARLTYDLALQILGKREEDENFAQSKQVSAFGKLRQMSWKVIVCTEKLQESADEIFSRFFKIRTAKEIHENKILDRDLDFIEIFRRAIGEEIRDSFGAIVSQILSIKLVQGLGYTLLGSSLMISRSLGNFIFGPPDISDFTGGLPPEQGIVNRIKRVYKQIEIEEKQANSIENE